MVPRAVLHDGPGQLLGPHPEKYLAGTNGNTGNGPLTPQSDKAVGHRLVRYDSDLAAISSLGHDSTLGKVKLTDTLLLFAFLFFFFFFFFVFFFLFVF